MCFSEDFTATMTSKINRDQVIKVANLARLAISPTEEEELVQQLSRILEYFEQLSELDTDDVEPTTRPIEISNISRPDQLVPWDDRESLLREAPEQDGDFFKVPKILGEEPS